MRARRFSAASLCVGLFLLQAGFAQASTRDEAASSLPFRYFGPYCGLVSIYAYARLEELDLPLERIVQKKYVGGPQGSSLADLERAASDNGSL